MFFLSNRREPEPILHALAREIKEKTAAIGPISDCLRKGVRDPIVFLHGWRREIAKEENPTGRTANPEKYAEMNFPLATHDLKAIGLLNLSARCL
jgi:hypothetical protein